MLSEVDAAKLINMGPAALDIEFSPPLLFLSGISFREVYFSINGGKKSREKDSFRFLE